METMRHIAQQYRHIVSLILLASCLPLALGQVDQTVVQLAKGTDVVSDDFRSIPLKGYLLWSEPTELFLAIDCIWRPRQQTGCYVFSKLFFVASHHYFVGQRVTPDSEDSAHARVNLSLPVFFSYVCIMTRRVISNWIRNLNLFENFVC